MNALAILSAERLQWGYCAPNSAMCLVQAKSQEQVILTMAPQNRAQGGEEALETGRCSDLSSLCKGLWL